MGKYRLIQFTGLAVEFLSLPRRDSIPWRRIAVDAGLLALAVLTSSWFGRR